MQEAIAWICADQYLRHYICMTSPQWVYALAKVMACWLMALRHHMNQVDLSSKKSMPHKPLIKSRYSSGAISQEVTQLLVTKFGLKIIYLKFCSSSPGTNWIFTQLSFSNIEDTCDYHLWLSRTEEDYGHCEKWNAYMCISSVIVVFYLFLLTFTRK